MPIGRPLLVGPAFLAFIWRRGFTFLNPLPRPFNFFADEDPGTRDGRCDIMLEWIKNYGVLGLFVEGNFGSGLRSERDENLLLFWFAVHRAAQCMALYKAATGPARLLKRSGVPGKTLAEKRQSAIGILSANVNNILQRHC
jgi:hypothetical protein